MHNANLPENALKRANAAAIGSRRKRNYGVGMFFGQQED